jgi:hypothetical protein
MSRFNLSRSPREFYVSGQRAASPNEGRRDMDTHIRRRLRAKHSRGHDGFVFGEGPRESETATAGRRSSRSQIVILDVQVLDFSIEMQHWEEALGVSSHRLHEPPCLDAVDTRKVGVEYHAVPTGSWIASSSCSTLDDGAERGMRTN